MESYRFNNTDRVTIPFIKRLGSYFWEVPLEQLSSRHNPHLQVSLNRGKIMLGSANAVYSFEDRYTTFKIAFEHLRPEKKDLKHILVLGFGLGSIPLLLAGRGFSGKITGVDIDPVVFELAQRYITFPDRLNLTGYAADAAKFVAQTTNTYDLICVDLFLDDQVPDKFEKQAFLQQLKELLAPNGYLLFNRLYYRPNFKAATDEFFENTFTAVFPQATAWPTGGNRMLVGRA